MAYISFEPSGHFNATGYTGNGSTQSITGVGFQPDLNIVKSRGVQNWAATDALRGVGQAIHPNAAYGDGATPDGLTAFNADGFSVGTDTTWNDSGVDYASWNWKAGTTTGIDATGATITPSSYSFNATSGFSMIKYVGTGVAATLPHGLGVAPTLIIQKNLVAGVTDNWQVYHSYMGATKYMTWNTTNVEGTNSTRWNDTEPTSVLFSIGTDSSVNGSGEDCLAYCFAPTQGFFHSGEYRGNGSSTQPPFIFTGFRPNWVIIKSYNVAAGWAQYSSIMSPYNGSGAVLYVNTTAAESAGSTYQTIDRYSNGFRVPYTSSNDYNGDGWGYLYMACAEYPFVSSNDVPATAF